MKARLTIVESIYHQPMDDKPTPLDIRHSEWLDSEEQPYGPRRLNADDQKWLKVDIGWLLACSHLVIENEPPKYEFIPTEEEKTEAESRVLQVVGTIGESPPSSEDRNYVHISDLKPGASIRLIPPPELLRRLWVRCWKGNTRWSITAFPL